MTVSVQLALNAERDDKITIDGILGPKMRNVLKKFQKSKGLKETGKMDKATLSNLGIIVS